MLSLRSYVCCKGTGMNGTFGSRRCQACGCASVLELHARRDQTKVRARREGCFAIRNLCSLRVLDSHGLFGSSPREKLPRLTMHCWNCPPGSYYHLHEMHGGVEENLLVWAVLQCLNDLHSASKPLYKAEEVDMSLRHLEYRLLGFCPPSWLFHIAS